MKAGQKQKKSSIIYLTLLLSVVFITSILLGILKPSVASAATFSELSIEDRAKVWVMGRAVSKCVSKIGFWHDNFSESDGANGEWLADDSGWGNQDANQELGEWTADIAEGNSDDAKVTCKKVAKVTLELMGVSVKDALCEMNELSGKTLWKRESGDCLNGAGDFDLDEDDVEEKDSDIWNDFFRKWLGGGVEESLTPGMRYIIYSENFYQECGNGEGGGWGTPREWKSGDSESDKVYKLRWNKEGATPDKEWYVAAQEHGKDHGVDIDGYGMLTSDDNLQCQTLAERINGNADAYLEEVAKSTDPDDPDDNDPGSGDPEEDGTTCNVDGIGWIVCPVMTFIAKLNDAAFGFLNNFLTIEPELLTDQNAKVAWEAFRNFANVAFAIAFLIIIYSQLTGAGISNYGLKKLLPKLIIAAVLVNLSYYICQIAVDISNIVGSGIYNFFKNIPIGVENGTAASDAGGLWESLVVGILIAGAFIALIAIVIFAPAALLAFALAVLILVARKAFLIILVVISPLAFVAYLLPNTEQWFKRWWKAFSTMLMLFPVVGAVFGGSVLASNILTNVAEQSSGDDKQMLLVVALGVMAIPLFAIPSLVKGSMAAAGAVGARLSGLQDRANRYGGKKIGQSRIGEAKTAFGARRQQRKVDARLGNGRVTKAGQFLSKRGLYGGKTLEAIGGAGAKFDQSSLGRRFGGDRGAAAAVYEQNKFKNEAVERSMALLQENKAADVVTKAREQLIAANKSGDVIGARAATRVLAQQTGSRGIDQLHSAISEIEKDGGTLHDNIGESVKHEVTAAGLKAKNRSLDKWSREEPTPTGTKLGDYDADRRSVSGLNEAELAGHSGAMLKTYAQSGALDSDSATRVLAAHQKGTVHLDEEKLSILQGVAGAAPPPPPSP